MKISDARYSEV